MNIAPNYALFDGQQKPIAIDPVAFYGWWRTHDWAEGAKEPSAHCPYCRRNIWCAPGHHFSCECGAITITRKAEST